MFLWPNGFKAALLLTIDIDGLAGMEAFLGPLDNRPSVASLMEYEARWAVPRMAEWVESEHIPVTFFVPGATAERHPDLIRDLARRGHEIGHHGYRHLKPDRITPEEEADEVERPFAILQSLTGRPIVGARTPAYAPSRSTLGRLKAQGIGYDTSLMGGDGPYRTEEGLLEIPSSWWMDDWEHWGYLPFAGAEYPMVDPKAVISLWTEHFRGTVEVGGCFVLTLHPWVSGRPGFLRVIKETLRGWRTAHPEVWWASGEQIYAHAVETGQ